MNLTAVFMAPRAIVLPPHDALPFPGQQPQVFSEWTYYRFDHSISLYQVPGSERRAPVEQLVPAARQMSIVVPVWWKPKGLAGSKQALTTESQLAARLVDCSR